MNTGQYILTGIYDNDNEHMNIEIFDYGTLKEVQDKKEQIDKNKSISSIEIHKLGENKQYSKTFLNWIENILKGTFEELGDIEDEEELKAEIDNKLEIINDYEKVLNLELSTKESLLKDILESGLDE